MTPFDVPLRPARACHAAQACRRAASPPLLTTPLLPTLVMPPLLLLLLAGCTTPPPPTPDTLRSTCAALAGHSVPASAIGLASRPAVVDRATLTAAATSAQSALPDHCQVQGHIDPLTAGAQRIHFQLNLPLKWNGKSLQYGGGGFNGTLVTGLAPLRDAEPTDALPLARGYATYGTDSGHQSAAFPGSDPGAFASNDEMLENFAFASYKKVRDVAVALMQRYYGRGPQRLYYFGGSEGGREGLAMAQRFPTDYDGIVSVVPVVNWTGLFHAFVRAQTLQFEAWLPPTKAALLARHVAQACDAADGRADGVINHALACGARVELQSLRCEDGADKGQQCLSDGQIAVLQALHTPYTFGFPLANGITDYPPWLWGHEDSLDGPAAVSLARWVTGGAAPTVPPNPATAATQWLYGSNWIRHAVARDAAFDVRRYRPQDFQARVQQTSELMDATNPNLAAFFARGGKIIVRENAGDRAQSPLMGVRYVDAVRGRLGDAALQRSLRLYWSPSSTHSGNARVVGGSTPVPTMVDLLDPLDRWVTQGQAPADALVQTQRAATAPFAVQATRPLCQYPNYPQFVAGDAAQAGSYRCTSAASVGRLLQPQQPQTAP